MTIDELITAARNGSTRAAGRLLSLVESSRRDEVLDALGATTLPRIVGVTGPPGAGKSTTVAALVSAYRARDMRVAVLAVDPSSPYSGGALLGDRIRMAAHINDPDVLIRSVATRGHLGGLAAAVPAATRLLAALSYDLIVAETVGVGQSEIEIAAIADPTIVVLNPGAGDAVQAAKAGLLEVADIVVVNKADRDGADQTVRDLRAETKAPILKLVAAQGEGIPELVDAIEVHHRADSPERRKARARAQILSLAQTRLRSSSRSGPPGGVGRRRSVRSLHRGGAAVRRPGRAMTARVLITGVDSAGRSCVVQQQPVSLSGTQEIAYSVLHATTSIPSLASNGGRVADHLDLGVAAGGISWMVIEYGPRVAFSMHHTDTVDLDTVLAGSVELTLDDGVHDLVVGDCVVVNGVDHAWRAGADGCRLSVMAIGVPTP